MAQYTFQQYEKFFENFEGTNAGWVYKSRTFCSPRLEELMRIIIDNIENEETMKEKIRASQKLGSQVVKIMYDDISLLNDMIATSTVGHPDFMDAIKLWRDTIIVPTDTKEVA